MRLTEKRIAFGAFRLLAENVHHVQVLITMANLDRAETRKEDYCITFKYDYGISGYGIQYKA